MHKTHTFSLNAFQEPMKTMSLSSPRCTWGKWDLEKISVAQGHKRGRGWDGALTPISSIPCSLLPSFIQQILKGYLLYGRHFPNKRTLYKNRKVKSNHFFVVHFVTPLKLSGHWEDTTAYLCSLMIICTIIKTKINF